MQNHLSNWTLPVSFHFQVEFLDDKNIGIVPFKEVSGLNTEIELESISEGGVNNFEHKLPKQVKHSNLILKGAVVLIDNGLISWIKNTLKNNFDIPIVRKDVKISLLNENQDPIYNWICNKAYPVKWDVEPLDSEKNNILIESFELVYETLKRI